jgi:hypothetical protein
MTTFEGKVLMFGGDPGSGGGGGWLGDTWTWDGTSWRPYDDCVISNCIAPRRPAPGARYVYTLAAP